CGRAAGAGAGTGFEDEQADATAPARRSAAAMARGRLESQTTLRLKESSAGLQACRPSPALVSHKQRPLESAGGFCCRSRLLSRFVVSGMNTFHKHLAGVVVGL